MQTFDAIVFRPAVGRLVVPAPLYVSFRAVVCVKFRLTVFHGVLFGDRFKKKN